MDEKTPAEAEVPSVVFRFGIQPTYHATFAVEQRFDDAAVMTSLRQAQRAYSFPFIKRDKLSCRY